MPDLPAINRNEYMDLSYEAEQHSKTLKYVKKVFLSFLSLKDRLETKLINSPRPTMNR